MRIRHSLESILWIVIISAVIFINISPQIIGVGRLQFIAAFTLFLLALVFNRFIVNLPFSWKKIVLRILVYLLFLFLFFYIFTFKKYNLWIFYFFPILLSLSLSLSLITQPRALTLTLVAISIFLLGDVYWGSQISTESARITFPLVFSKIFSLSLLSILGYYLYRRELLATEEANIFSQNLKKLNEELNLKTEELQKANERLKELAEVKSRFVATVSHELRTPLTAIRNSLKLIGYEIKDNRTVDEYLSIIKNNVERQTMMIDNLLDLARIERGYPQGVRSQVDLNEVIEEVIDLFKDEAINKDIRLLFQPKKDVSFIWADQEQIRRVFINFIDNGIKFTPNGGWVEVSLFDEKDNVKAVIADNGPGIPKENQDKIFEAFVQLEEGSSKGIKKGIGLGLTMVKEIIDLHKGRVGVESELGKGAKFFVLLPKDLRKSNEATT